MNHRPAVSHLRPTEPQPSVRRRAPVPRPRHPREVIETVRQRTNERETSSVPSDESGQPFCAPAAGKNPAADLGLAEHRVLAAGVAQIAGQGQSVPAAPGPSAGGRDADERSWGQPYHEIGPRRCRLRIGRRREVGSPAETAS